MLNRNLDVAPYTRMFQHEIKISVGMSVWLWTSVAERAICTWTMHLFSMKYCPYMITWPTRTSNSDGLCC